MHVIVDIRSNIELGLASEEIRAKFEECRQLGQDHLKFRTYSGEHKVIVVEKKITPKPLKPREKLPLFFQPDIHAPVLSSLQHAEHILSREIVTQATRS